MKGILTTLIISLSVFLLSFSLILVLPIWLLSRSCHYRQSCFLANTWGLFCAWWSRVVCRVTYTETGDACSQNETAIVLANHQSMVDIAAFFFFAGPRARIGNTKSFAKNSMKYWPGLGWALVLLDFIIVKRDWQKDEAHIHNAFNRILSRNAPFWLFIFPEGTRVTLEKLKRSQEFARQKQLPHLQHVLLPRTKGFVSALTSLRGHIDAVYDLTIDYGIKIPSLWDVACGKPCHVTVTVHRHPVSALPVKDEDVTAWLIQRFVKKDETLKSLHSNVFLSQPQ